MLPGLSSGLISIGYLNARARDYKILNGTSSDGIGIFHSQQDHAIIANHEESRDIFLTGQSPKRELIYTRIYVHTNSSVFHYY